VATKTEIADVKEIAEAMT